MKMSVKHTFLPAILSAAVAATLPTTTFAQLEEVLVTAESARGLGAGRADCGQCL